MASITLMTQAAYLYYIKQQTQAQIAQQLHIDRSSVSRLLKEARANGIVHIEINHFDADLFALQDKLKQRFSLTHVCVTPEKDFASTAGRDLAGLMKSNQTIGISWGSTIGQAIQTMPQKHLKHVKIFPVVGGPGYIDTQYHVNTLVYELSQKLKGTGTFINASVIEESAATRQSIMAAKYFAPIQTAWHHLDLALVSVGGGLNAHNQWQQLLTPADVADLKLREAVGDCCGQFYDGAGKIIDNEVARRTIAIPLAQLSQVPLAIAIAHGRAKTRALLPLLTRHYVNGLIVDRSTAENILKH